MPEEPHVALGQGGGGPGHVGLPLRREGLAERCGGDEVAASGQLQGGESLHAVGEALGSELGGAQHLRGVEKEHVMQYV